MAAKLKESTLWKKGPELLVTSKLPKTLENVATEEAEKERIKSVIQTKLVHEELYQIDLKTAIGVSRFSQEIRLCRVTAYLLRFIANLKSRISQTSQIEGAMTTEKIRVAKRMRLVDAQREH